MTIKSFKGGIMIDGRVITDATELGMMILENVQDSERQLTLILNDYRKLAELINLQSQADLAHDHLWQIMNRNYFPKCLPRADNRDYVDSYSFYVPHMAVNFAQLISERKLIVNPEINNNLNNKK